MVLNDLHEAHLRVVVLVSSTVFSHSLIATDILPVPLRVPFRVGILLGLHVELVRI